MVMLFTEIAVYDPLHRRYLLLPPVPKGLMEIPIRFLTEPSLAPPSEEDQAEETSFRVIWMARCKTKPVALIFSSNTGQWRGAASQTWSDLELSFEPVWGDFLSSHHYSYGCIYWQMDLRGYLLVLHTRTMEFSIAEPPLGAGEWRQITIVEAGEDMPGVFALENGTSNLYCTIRQNNLWQTQKAISLDSAYLHYITGATERYLILRRNRNVEGRLLEMPDYERFTLDIRTLQLERMCGLKQRHTYERFYTNFAPSFLSLPTV